MDDRISYEEWNEKYAAPSTSWDTVGHRLRLAREAAGLSQADAADSLELSKSSLAKIERGRQRIDLATAVKMARLYAASLDALLAPDEEAKK